MNNPKWTIRKGKVVNDRYEKFIRSKSCIICGVAPVDLHHNFHVRSSSYFGIPLCRQHHTGGSDSYHNLEHRAFEKKHNINLWQVMFELLTEFIENELASKNW